MKSKWHALLHPTHQEMLWELFHVNSRCTPGEIAGPAKPVPPQKKGEAPFAPYSHCPAIALPSVSKKLDMSLVDAIQGRASKSSLTRKGLTLEELSLLLTASYTVKENSTARTAPSAGALYPIDIYLHLSSLNTTPKVLSPLTLGLYYYHPLKNEVRQLIDRNCDAEMESMLMQPELVKTSTLQLFLTATFPKVTHKYHDRGYRFAFLEAGHIAQNINLVATAMGLTCLNLGGYYEEKTNRFLKIDGLSHSVIYMLLLGH